MCCHSLAHIDSVVEINNDLGQRRVQISVHSSRNTTNSFIKWILLISYTVYWQYNLHNGWSLTLCVPLSIHKTSATCCYYKQRVQYAQCTFICASPGAIYLPIATIKTLSIIPYVCLLRLGINFKPHVRPFNSSIILCMYDLVYVSECV